MSRKVTAFIINHLLRPPLLVIGFIVRILYWSLYGWWGEKRYNARQQEKLKEQILTQFVFLFQDHNGRIVPNYIENRMLAGWPVVTVNADGLFICFIKWRDERHVMIAPERLPNEWHDVAKVLNAMNPDHSSDHGIADFADAARILNKSWTLLKEGFSPGRYPHIKDQFEWEHRQAMAETRLVEREINRKFYPDR